MKSIPVEDLDRRLAKALEQSGRDDAVLLTENSEPVGVLVRLPVTFKDSHIDVAVFAHSPGGPVLVLFQAKTDPTQQEIPSARPEFGRGRGMLRVVAEDDEHLQDFTEYMR